MGMLPIFLIMLGFLLLWAVLTYNSLKIKRSEVEVTEARVQDLMLQRMAFLQKAMELADQHNDQAVVTALNELLDGEQENSREKLRSNSQMHPETEMMVTEFLGADKGLTETRQRLVAQRKSYNSLIVEYPTKFISQAMRIKPIS